MVKIISLYENDIIDIMIENINEINKFTLLFIFKNKNIKGIVPITEDKNIFLKLVILVNNILTPINIT